MQWERGKGKHKAEVSRLVAWSTLNSHEFLMSDAEVSMDCEVMMALFGGNAPKEGWTKHLYFHLSYVLGLYIRFVSRQGML